MGEFEKYVTEQTEAKVHKETALEMLKDKKPLHEIVKYSKLAKDVVLQLAKENGLEVVIGQHTVFVSLSLNDEDKAE